MNKPQYKFIVLKAFVVLIGFGFFGSCSVQKPTDPTKIDVENYTGKKIVVGTEGGITSLRNETIIIAEGYIYYHNNLFKEYKYIKTLTKDQNKKVFKAIRNPKLPKEGFNHPGQMSTFLEIYIHQKPVYKYIWGEPGVDIPEPVDKAYSEIINTIK